MAPPVALLSGDRGVGKSTLALRLAHALQQDHGAESVVGVVTERTGSMRTAILLPANDRMPLAADTRGPEGEAAGFTGPAVGPFRFSRPTIEAVNELFTAAPPGLAATRRLWILDEVGPLELRKGEGFLPAVDALVGMVRGAAGESHAGTGAPRAPDPVAESGPRRSRAAALIVVRPELLGEVRGAFPPDACAVYHLTAATRGRAYRALRDWLTARLNGSAD